MKGNRIGAMLGAIIMMIALFAGCSSRQSDDHSDYREMRKQWEESNPYNHY